MMKAGGKLKLMQFTGRVIKIKFKNTTIDEEKDFDRPGDEAPQDIIELALRMVPGEVVHARKKERDDQSFWFIAIMTPANSLVKVALTTTGELLQIKGSEKPFDYVVEPGNDLLSFSAAKEILASEIDGELLEWKLRERERDDLLIWVYHFDLAKGDELFEVKINALTGTIIEFDEAHEDDGVRHLPQELIDRIVDFIEGEVIEAEIDTKHDRRAWKITLVTADGSEVEIILDEESLELIRISGEHGDFDYEVTPGDELLRFSEILERILDTGDEILIEWALDFTDDQRWVYKVVIVVGETEIYIKIDAATGEILFEEIDEIGPEDTIPEDLLDFATHLVNGEVAAVFEEKGDLIYWVVKIETDTGAHVFVGLTKDGHLVNIEDREGPFDYNVEPGMDLISFAEAKEIALDTGDEELVGWELEHNNEEEWFYKLFIVVGNDELTVKIDALTGDII